MALAALRVGAGACAEWKSAAAATWTYLPDSGARSGGNLVPARRPWAAGGVAPPPAGGRQAAGRGQGGRAAGRQRAAGAALFTRDAGALGEEPTARQRQRVCAATTGDLGA